MCACSGLRLGTSKEHDQAPQVFTFISFPSSSLLCFLFLHAGHVPAPPSTSMTAPAGASTPAALYTPMYWHKRMYWWLHHTIIANALSTSLQRGLCIGEHLLEPILHIVVRCGSTRTSSAGNEPITNKLKTAWLHHTRAGGCLYVASVNVMNATYAPTKMLQKMGGERRPTCSSLKHGVEAPAFLHT